MTTTTSAPKLPKGLTVTVAPSSSSRDLYTEAEVAVSTSGGQTGGRLRFVFHDNAIVILSLDRAPDPGFVLRAVPYSLGIKDCRRKIEFRRLIRNVSREFQIVETLAAHC